MNEEETDQIPEDEAQVVEPEIVEETPAEAFEPPHAPVSTLQAIAHLYKISPRMLLYVGVVTGALVCFGIVKAVAAGKRNAAKTEAEMASWRLFGSKSPQQLDALVARFPSSELVPIAVLKLAQAHFYEGNLQAAFANFDKFVKEHVAHPMFFAAWLGKIVCLETTGKKEQIESALKEYSLFAQRPAPTGPTPEQQAEQIIVRNVLAAEAQFGRGRCLEQLDRLEEAKQVYSELAVAKSPVWVDRAEQAVERVETAMKRLAGSL